MWYWNRDILFQICWLSRGLIMPGAKEKARYYEIKQNHKH
jgi:hypothetical protein